MSEWPMSDVVEQRGGKEQLGILWRNRGSESFIGREPVEIFDRRQEDAKRVLVTSMVGGRIDEPYQPELTNVSQTTKRGRIDESPHATGEGHIDARRYPHA